LDDIYYEKVLNRIIQGRLRVKLGDLVLYIYEPSNDLIEESFDIYEEAHKKAYYSGCYIDSEIQEMLVEFDLWSPVEKRRLKQLEDEEIENAKVEAYQNFFDKGKLRAVKRRINQIESEIMNLRLKHKQLDHMSCDGIAKFTRKAWIFERVTKTKDGKVYDFANHSIGMVLDAYSNNQIPVDVLRRIARTDPWRSMWNSTRKRSRVFNVDGCDLNDMQLGLSSWTTMYENLYENPDCPKDGIVEDDDCLDGWFILEKRKREKEKREREAEDALSGNSKIANSQEVFLMANNQQQAQDINSLNSPQARGIVRQRNQQIKDNEGDMNFKDLADVHQDRMINAVNQNREAVKRRN
jgi:hypothetical protein